MKPWTFGLITTVVLSLGIVIGATCQYYTFKDELDRAVSGAWRVIYQGHTYTMTEVKVPLMKRMGQ